MSMKLNVKQVVDVVGGKLSSGDSSRDITGVVIDSRRSGPGSLFIAFRGERADGHDFLVDCAGKGTVAALVEKDIAPQGEMAIIRVEDTLLALQRLATWQRNRHKQLQVIGITGSSGKTTTKELVAGVLAEKYSTFKSRGNHNNAIGLPLMLFELADHHRWAVLEMGMSAPGEIHQLCRISSPGIGIITNIGQAHLEHLGSQREILEAKFELAKSLAPPRMLILNGDDPLQREKAKALLPDVKVIFYGLDRHNCVRATDVCVGPAGTSFTVRWRGKSAAVKLNLLGAHNVSNGLAAFTAGLLLDVEPAAIVKGLAGVRGERRRLETIEVDGMTIIDDSYNANPDSMAKALAVLQTYPPGRRKVAFLGDMLELGPSAREKHWELGKLAAQLPLALLVAVGQYAAYVKEGAIAGGMKEEALHLWEDSPRSLASTRFLKPGDVILIKGSLGVDMAKIVQSLTAGRTE